MFGEKLKQGDNLAIKLQCAHPNVKIEEKCPYCGEVLEDVKDGEEKK